VFICRCYVCLPEAFLFLLFVVSVMCIAFFICVVIGPSLWWFTYSVYLLCMWLCAINDLEGMLYVCSSDKGVARSQWPPCLSCPCRLPFLSLPTYLVGTIMCHTCSSYLISLSQPVCAMHTLLHSHRIQYTQGP
jgi:hypothetical protein